MTVRPNRPSAVTTESTADDAAGTLTPPGADSGTVPYCPDLVSSRATALSALGAAAGGGLATYVCWRILRTTNLPAFGNSYVSRAAATALTVLLLATVVTFVYLWLQDEHARRHGHEGTRSRLRSILTPVLCYLSPAGLVVATLAVPLSATRLWLDGISVDQGFRTQYLTRLADSAHLSDMNYADMPPFYPAGWFWLGGRFAALTGLPGWEAFQPWSLITIAAAGCILVPVWQHLTGSLPVATAISLVTMAITLVISSHEPYAAIIALGAPAAAVLSRRALDGSRASLLGITVYLGLSATMYTLFTAVIALSVVVITALMVATTSRSIRPIVRLVAIGCSSILLALSVWWPYVRAVLSGQPLSSSSATHYLPMEGTEIPLPMLSFSLVGVLCFIGLIYLVVRASDRDVRALGVALVVYYGWSVASMIASLAGTTLLGFRLDILITVQLATAGVLALAELRLVGITKLYPQQLSPRVRQAVTTVMVIVLACGGVHYAQDIPNKISSSIDLAYTDTDGTGKRADLTPSDSGRYYADIDAFIHKHIDRPSRDIELLTDEFNLLSYYPYRGFQGLTAHYANPLGLFELRNDVIESWSKASNDGNLTPQEFATLMDSSEFGSPDAIVMRHSGDQWTYDISEDIYPNSPNVRFRGVYFADHVFTGEGSPWTVTTIGPFVVAVRTDTQRVDG